MATFRTINPKRRANCCSTNRKSASSSDLRPSKALVPLSFYWKNGNVKVALAACKGKVQYDKRQDMKKRDADRELKRATMRRLKGR